MSDTICALSTAVGGAIGVIRVSGDKSLSIVAHLLRSKKTGKEPDIEGRKLIRFYGDFYSPQGMLIDDVVANFFYAPHSYTGEDSVEISCHGSSYILHQAIVALIDAGCRQAEPGEYTKRAYLNGKMDLSQAEAVADLIAATNKMTHQVALGQLRGHITNELSKMRDQLLKLNSLLQLELDFSDHEELEFADRSELLSLSQALSDRINHLAASFETGRAIKDGVAVAIVGKTNVGKSTLLNRLLKEDRAIVSDIHGTTRDVIEDTTTINGILFRFIDTAGLRKTSDEIERLGIERTYKKLSEASIVLWMLDATPSEEECQKMIEKTEKKKLIRVFNKIDLHQQASASPTQGSFSDVYVSAKYGTNIESLEQMLCKAAGIPEITENDVIITSARHYEALRRASASITRVIDGLTSGLSSDLISEDLHICLEQLGEITGGEITPQETLNNIFSHFCIGK